MANSVAESKGLFKAATLLFCLGVERASKVLQYLGESELERAFAAVSEVGTVTHDVRAEVMQRSSGINQGIIQYDFGWGRLLPPIISAGCWTTTRG